MLCLLYAGLKMFISQFTTFQIKFLVKQEDQGLKPNSNYVHDIDLDLHVFSSSIFLFYLQIYFVL